jgi:tRNA(Ile2) C34 agmatinyltransferase TiaS
MTIQLVIPHGKRDVPRNRACLVCGSRQMDYRVRTHDYRCKDCKAITQISARCKA